MELKNTATRAAERKKVITVEMLRKGGTALKAKDFGGFTPFHVARREGSKEAARVSSDAMVHLMGKKIQW